MKCASGKGWAKCATPSCCKDAGGGYISIPGTFQVVLSGITYCPSTCTLISFDLSLLSLWGKYISGDVNGTYCCSLVSSSGPCIYSATIPSPLIFDLYTNSSCTSFYGRITIDTVKVSVGASGAAYIEIKASTVIGNDEFAAFFQTVFANQNCDGGVYSDEVSVCGPNAYRPHVGYSGTAVVTPNGC